MSISVETMIRYHLETLGADGLCNPDEECGCEIEDLAPCGDCLNLQDCKAAKWFPEGDEDHPEGFFKVLE